MSWPSEQYFCIVGDLEASLMSHSRFTGDCSWPVIRQTRKESDPCSKSDKHQTTSKWGNWNGSLQERTVDPRVLHPDTWQTSGWIYVSYPSFQFLETERGKDSGPNKTEMLTNMRSRHTLFWDWSLWAYTSFTSLRHAWFALVTHIRPA